MSAEATAYVWAHSPLTGAQLIVHLAIADVVNDVHGNEFWMSRSALATKCRVSRSTVTETLTELCKRDLLVRLAGSDDNKPSRYRFLMWSESDQGGRTADGGGRRAPERWSESSHRTKGTQLNSSAGDSHFVTHCAGCGHITLNCTCGRSDADKAPPPWKVEGLTYAEWRERAGTLPNRNEES